MRSGRIAGFMALELVALLAIITACTAEAPLPRLKGYASILPEAVGEAAAERHPLLLRPDDAVHFQVIGDWGRQGGYNQSDVADAMAAAARGAPPEFVVSVGDNFYPSGLTSVDDANFAQSFTDVYRQPELQVPWYAVAGNHDYGDGIAPGDPPPECAPDEPAWRCSAGLLTQLSAELRQRDGRWQCRCSRVLSLAGGALDIFMYDTTPFVQYYYDQPWAANPGGIREQSWMANLVELEAALAASEAGWKLVVGHHPVRSNGEEHGDTPELRRWVEPLLERYGVQLYLAGHDHDLELIREPGRATHHIVSGAGSATRPLAGTADALFQHGAQGFVAISVRRDALEASFFGLEGRQLMYTATIPRAAPANSGTGEDEERTSAADGTGAAVDEGDAEDAAMSAWLEAAAAAGPAAADGAVSSGVINASLDDGPGTAAGEAAAQPDGSALGADWPTLEVLAAEQQASY
jgi:tartrate-resistant acid phosphatase type 5